MDGRTGRVRCCISMGRARDGADYLDRAERWAASGLEPAEIARREGVNRKVVANAIRAARLLVDEVKVALRAKKIASAAAVRLAKLSPAEQRARLTHATPAQGSLQMKVSAIRELQEAIRTSSKAPGWKEGALKALECVLDDGNIPGIWPPAERGHARRRGG